jgi:glycosyltransferase involved in cell wall biosynthesis
LVYPKNPESIAWGIEYVLSNPGHARWLAKNAKDAVQKIYSWDIIAKRTSKVYEEVIAEAVKE